MMNVPRPEPGPRFSGSELRRYIAQAVRRAKDGLPPIKFPEIRDDVAAWRSKRYLAGDRLRFLRMGQVSFLLCRSKAFVRQLILNGDLSADFIPASETSCGHWLIPAAEVRQLAEGRDGDNSGDPMEGPAPR